jgi:hypothetical protein
MAMRDRINPAASGPTVFAVMLVMLAFPGSAAPGVVVLRLRRRRPIFRVSFRRSRCCFSKSILSSTRFRDASGGAARVAPAGLRQIASPYLVNV